MIDAHHHLWSFRADDYGWIGPGMDVLRRDFLLDDLRPDLAANGVEGLVTVQACQTPGETAWLLELAERHPEIRGVVGWVPLVDPEVGGTLEHLAQHPRLKGVRHILQDEPDEAFMLRQDFNHGIAMLGRFGLTYDILVFERQLPQTLTFVDRHPDQVFILDHAAKPRIRDAELSPWRERLTELAAREHVFCKISGLLTEARWDTWTDADVQPYLDVVLEAFGPKRLMFGSDWPVLLLAADYTRWVQMVRQAIRPLSSDEQAWITRRTAEAAYSLA
jgi:L-fuconolactonase